jgi:hypothetical protein
MPGEVLQEMAPASANDNPPPSAALPATGTDLPPPAARTLCAAHVGSRTRLRSELEQAVALGLAHALADIRDGTPCKPPELRRLCLRLAVGLSGFELR